MKIIFDLGLENLFPGWLGWGGWVGGWVVFAMIIRICPSKSIGLKGKFTDFFTSETMSEINKICEGLR